MLDVLGLLQGRIPSGWIVDIWDCHGVLKQKEYAGYGIKNNEVLEDMEKTMKAKYTWFECGWYTVPLRQDILKEVKEAGLEQELSERLEKVLNWIVYDCNGGAINFSGWYMVSIEELKAVEKCIQRVYRKALLRNKKLRKTNIEAIKYLEV